MASAYRLNRINEETAKALSEIIRDVKDFRLTEAVLSIVGVSTAPDLSVAKVYYSYIGSCDEKEIQKGLVSASGYIRSRLAETLNLRRTPKLTFVHDLSAERGAKIFALMKKVEGELEESEQREREQDEQNKSNDEENA